MSHKPSIPGKHYDKSGKYCVFEVFKRPRKTVYYVRGSQSNHVSEITLEGFEGLPPGLYLKRDGWGIGKKGVFFLSAIKESFASNKPLELIITSKPIKKVKKSGAKVIVIVPYNDMKNLLVKLKRINEESNIEIKEAVASFLSTKFPRHIRTSSENFDDYKSGELAALLRRKDVVKKLNEEDLDGLSSIFPKIFDLSIKRGGKRKASKDALINKAKNQTDRIYLDQVINEFSNNLKKQHLSEEKWQSFLRSKVFRFIASYVTTIEKHNVSIDISYPDFVSVDIYGFVDIFEIKRHDTELLSYDGSHENYYWKPEIAKAISQIENYIEAINANSDAYIKSIKRKKGLDIKVVRPRGYIVAGASKQFANSKEEQDFRMLAMSLKNVSFILYDELLDRLKNLRSKL